MNDHSKWIEAAAALVSSPYSQVPCPNCGLAFLSVEDERVDDALNAFKSLGQHREADSGTPGAGTSDPKPQKSKIVIGSATIFILNVDQFERY